MNAVKRPIQLVKNHLSTQSNSQLLDTTILDCLAGLNSILVEWDISFKVVVIDTERVSLYSSTKRNVEGRAGRVVNLLRPFSSIPLDGFVCRSRSFFNGLYGAEQPLFIFHMPFLQSWGAIHWVCCGKGYREVLGGERRLHTLKRKLQVKNEEFNKLYALEQQKSINAATEMQETFQSFSHEIKSPLQTLLTLSENSELSDEVKSVVSHAKKMVHEVLDVSQTISIYYSDWSIVELLAELKLYYTHHKAFSRIVWECVDSKVYCDRSRLLQCCIAIIDNGLKKCIEGVTLWFHSSIEGKMVEIEIANSGEEIPIQYQESIFKPYVSYTKGGSGLGLSMAKRIMTAMNGDLFLNHSIEKETVFCLRVPLCRK